MVKKQCSVDARTTRHCAGGNELSNYIAAEGATAGRKLVRGKMPFISHTAS